MKYNQRIKTKIITVTKPFTFSSALEFGTIKFKKGDKLIVKKEGDSLVGCLIIKYGLPIANPDGGNNLFWFTKETLKEHTNIQTQE